MVFELRNVLSQQGSFRLAIAHWHAPAGEVRAILGCNGAGKSTMLRVLAGDIPSSGHRMLHGKPIEQWPDLDRARHVAFLPQASELNFSFVAEEVVALGAIPLDLGWRELEASVREKMVVADCTDLRGKPYPQLSGGEKQRVHFARVLLQLSQADEAPLLLLDEPTSAQDLKQQHRLLRMVQSLSHEAGFAVVAVLHDLNHALRYTDHCTLMSKGEIAEAGAPRTVLTPANVGMYWEYPAAFATAATGERVLY